MYSMINALCGEFWEAAGECQYVCTATARRCCCRGPCLTVCWFRFSRVNSWVAESSQWLIRFASASVATCWICVYTRPRDGNVVLNVLCVFRVVFVCVFTMSSATSSGNIVVEWLKSLHLGQYAESFLDNGYDDLEICKQVGDPDLDAIGVFNSTHRHRLLQSVRTLREEGAASVYFTLEESAAIQEECLCDSASIRSSRASSGTGKTSDKELPSKNSASAGSSSTGSVQELHAYHDEYEEGKAELVRIPRLQLKSLLKEKLSQDGIQLSNQPYSTMVSPAMIRTEIFWYWSLVVVALALAQRSGNPRFDSCDDGLWQGLYEAGRKRMGDQEQN